MKNPDKRGGKGMLPLGCLSLWERVGVTLLAAAENKQIIGKRGFQQSRNTLFHSLPKPKKLMWKIFSIAYRIAKKNAAYRIKFAKNFIQPSIPKADTIMVERASAISIAQRIPIKNNAHFLIVADSMVILGFLAIKTSITGRTRKWSSSLFSSQIRRQ
ncbi:MAG: hypothetical protein NTZ37_02355 [Methanoregula sp.]|jgi:hypothetical protein|nr:hypothetical protein [Methanoregula sp.]